MHKLVPDDAPLILAGDFNDWLVRAGRFFEDELGMAEVFETHHGKSARSYPSILPMFQLDRIYVRRFSISGCARPNRQRPAPHFRPRRAHRQAQTGLMTARNRLRKLIFRVFAASSRSPGNHVRLLQSGAEFFPALIAAIDAAHTEIHLETYIFNADPSAEAVRDAPVRAARRGVRVRFLIDGVGSRELPAAWLDALRTAGVSVLIYRPLTGRGWRSNPKTLRRLHRKLAVIDARIALVGGMNLMDDFEPVRFDAPRLDFSVEVQGPLLGSIHRRRSACVAAGGIDAAAGR